MRRFRRTDDNRARRVNTANTFLTAANVRERSERTNDSERWGAFFGAEPANDRELSVGHRKGRCTEMSCSAERGEPQKYGWWVRKPESHSTDLKA